MKRLLTAAALCAAVLAAHSAEPAKAATEQQNKMSSCNKEAGDRKGDERKAFMKECLSAKPAAAASQQDKMTTCNKEAAGKKGDERKSFMKECLSGKT